MAAPSYALEARRPFERRLAIAAWLVILAFEVVALAIWAGTGWANPAYAFMTGWPPFVAMFASLFAQATSALILTLRRPENAVGWTIVGFTLLSAAASPLIALTARPGATDAGVAWLAWAATCLVYPGATLLAFRLAFIFPSGRPLSDGWGRAFRLITVLTAVTVVTIALRPGGLLFFPAVQNPVGGLAPSGTEWISTVAIVLLAGAGTFAAAALIERYRTGDEIARIQARWYIASGVLLAGLYVPFTLAILVLAPDDPRGEAVATAFYVTLGLPPVAIAIAILRYRLYDIDTIISHAFVYGALTALLAGIYTASIRLFNSLFVTVTGQGSDAALVLSTLLLATTFTPIKSRLEAFARRRLVSGPVLPETPASFLSDPSFQAALDARIAALVRDEIARARTQVPDALDLPAQRPAAGDAQEGAGWAR